MTKGRPFYFDANVFDAVEQPSAEELAKAPKYTEDQMALARSAAFNDGKKAGFTESQNAIEKEIQGLLTKIESHANKLFSVESVRYERYEAEAVHLSYQIVKKIFPLLFEKIGEEQLQIMVKDLIASQKSTRAIDLHVHTDIAPVLQEYLASLSSKNGKTFTITASPSIPKNDCNLSWDYGGAVLAPEKTAHKILLLMQEALADQGITVHDEVHHDDSDVMATAHSTDDTTGDQE